MKGRRCAHCGKEPILCRTEKRKKYRYVEHHDLCSSCYESCLMKVVSETRETNKRLLWMVIKLGIEVDLTSEGTVK